MARLFADENFPRRVSEALRMLGHDVLTIQEAGYSNLRTEDLDVLAIASRQNRAVLTNNRRHFIALHMSGQAHSGIVVCTEDPDVQGQAQRIHEAVATLDTLVGALVRVNRPSQ
ncbi:MAG: DUF5615 family PIN-like protein [Caldilineaceae bacterium]